MKAGSVLAELEKEAALYHLPILRKAEREVFLSVVKKAAPRRILEIGTAIGYSALLMAEAMPEAQITTIEIDPKRHRRAAEAVRKAGEEERISCLLGDASLLIPALEGAFDLLYLDGPKGQYLRHLKLAEPLLSGHAAVLADNVLFRGLVAGRERAPHRYRTIVMRLREYISYVKKQYDTVIYPDGDGLSVSVKRI